MTKNQRNEPVDLDLAHKGLIPWSTKEWYSLFAKYRTKQIKLVDKNVDDLAVLVEVFQKEYPDELEFKAHIYRFHLIRTFIFKYGRQLVEDGFAATEGKPGLRDELMDILCTLSYSKSEKGVYEEKTYTFLYSEVKDAALKKINAHLN